MTDRDDEGVTPIETEPLLGPSPVRVIREHKGWTVVLGPWAARFSHAHSGCFANGSRWFSGWHRWQDDA